MQRKQQGFTLIELVIVIVILGVLSAFALPRFADLGSEARASSIQGAAGALRAASAITRSACLVSTDCPNDSSDTITLEGEDINLENGYPAAAANGIQLAAQLTGDADADGAGDYQITIDGTTLTVASRGASGTCETVYTEATEDAGEVTASSVDTDVSGC